MSFAPVAGPPTDESPPLTAGDFGSWLARIEAALRGAGDSEVPCGGCTACCRSGQFVTVGPDETEALAHLPGELLFPAPWRPEGHQVLALTEEGQCPMLVDDHCSIYPHRPRACRAYDCRIFAATDVEVGAGQPDVAQRAAQWRFTFESEADQVERDACRAGAAYIGARPDLWTDVTPSPVRVAAAAVTVRDQFLRPAPGGGPASVSPVPADDDELARRLGPA